MTTPIAIPQDADKIRQAIEKTWPHPHPLFVGKDHVETIQALLAHYQAFLNASPDPEPFDLARAKAGEAVQTRNGRKVRLLCFDRKHSRHPIVGLIEYTSGEEESDYWMANGRSFASEEASGDLLMAPRPVEHRLVWLNVYPGSTQASFSPTKESADNSAGPNRIACIPVAVPEGRKG